MGCELVICAGDLVDGGVFPDEVLARLASERESRPSAGTTIDGPSNARG
jgi:hypothetical protein